jgi:hypothetical protein
MHLETKLPLTCELLVSSNSAHLQQIYTGFNLLRERSVIRLTQKICTHEADWSGSRRGQTSEAPYLKALINDHHVIYYDTHDGFEIDHEALKEVDFYFKRSYSDREISSLKDKHKIFPLGLNCEVYAKRFDVSLLQRGTLQSGIAKLRNLLIATKLNHALGQRIHVDRVDHQAGYPDFSGSPKILFMTRAFGPEFAKSKEKQEEIDSLNHTRAQCIRRLKAEFREDFLGGFMYEDYALAKFKDCLVPNNNLSKRRNYMQLMRAFPICVATTGLHGSVGWKLAEFVSNAKAIVTETLNYRVPGHFERGENYLDFVSAEGCVESSMKLFHDPELRSKLMLNNYKYYQCYLRPDSLVLNTLATAISSHGDTFPKHAGPVILDRACGKPACGSQSRRIRNI